MSTLQHPSDIDVQIEQDVVTHSTARRALAALRIGFGVTFLWAFFDKLLALGYSTGVNPETGAVDRFGPDAWINGGSPTFGFLTFGVPADNPFQEFFNGLAGDTWVNWLFMLSLLGIGLALTFGVGMRIAAASGARALPDDVAGLAAPGEQPGRRRPPARSADHGRARDDAGR